MADTPKEVKPSKTFNINEFRSEMQLNGVMRNNQFLAVLTRPKKGNFSFLYDQQETKDLVNSFSKDLVTYTLGDTRFLSLRCESASIPGVNFFSTDNIRRFGYGQIERRPYLPQFNPITLTFAVDEYGKVMQYFYEWSRSIVDHDVIKEIMPDTSYFLNFKDDYICKRMNIWMYSPDNDVVVQCSLRDVFPLTISDTSLSWGSQDDFVRLSVTMQYTDISINFASVKDNKGSFEVLSNSKKPNPNGDKLERSRNNNIFRSLFDSKISDLEEKVVNKIFNLF